MRAKRDFVLAMGLHRIHTFHEFSKQVPLGCILLLHFLFLAFRAARSASSARLSCALSSFVKSAASSLSYSVSSQTSC